MFHNIILRLCFVTFEHRYTLPDKHVYPVTLSQRNGLSTVFLKTQPHIFICPLLTQTPVQRHISLPLKKNYHAINHHEGHLPVELSVQDTIGSGGVCKDRGAHATLNRVWEIVTI